MTLLTDAFAQGTHAARPAAAAANKGFYYFETDTQKLFQSTGSVWTQVASVGGGTVSPLTTKGDLYGFDTTDDRLPVGADGQVLTADSTQALGLKWAAPSGGDVLHTVSASGAAQTVDYSTADTWDITLTANCTLTLAGFTSGKPDFLTLILRQDATGSRAVTWPTITWIGSGIPPTLQTAAGSVDSVVLFSFDGGTTVYGIAQTSQSGLRSGTSFPGSPSDGDLFYRTDTRILYEYNSTVSRWLSLDRKYMSFGPGDALFPIAAGATIGRLPCFEDIYIESWEVNARVSGTNNGSNFWTLSLQQSTAAVSVTTITSVTTSADTSGNFVRHNVVVGSVVDSSTEVALFSVAAASGAPGTLAAPSVLVCRSAG